jgi:hypothetical protein
MDTTKIIIIYLIILLLIGIVGAYFMLRRTKKEKERELDNKEWTERVGTSEYEVKAINELKNQAIKKGMAYFIPFVFSIVAILLGKLWDWWYKPLKIVLTFVIAGLGAGIILFLAWNTSHGKIFITVRGEDFQKYPQLLSGVNIVIEARDTTTNKKDILKALSFKFREGKESAEGSVVLTSNQEGYAFSNFSGIYKEKNIAFRINVKDTLDLFDSASVELPYNSLIEHIVTLKRKVNLISGSSPLKAIIPSSPEIMKAFPPGGSVRPKTYNMEIYCLDKKDMPNNFAKFYLKNKIDEKGEVFKKVSEGSYKFEKLEIDKPYFIDYFVTDGSNLVITYSFSDDYKPTTEEILVLESLPKLLISKDSAKGDKAISIDFPAPKFKVTTKPKEGSGGGKGDVSQYQIVILNEKEKPVVIRGKIKISSLKGNIAIDPVDLNTRDSILYPKYKLTNLDEFWTLINGINIKIEDFENEKKTSMNIKKNDIIDGKLILMYDTRNYKLTIKK